MMHYKRWSPIVAAAVAVMLFLTVVAEDETKTVEVDSDDMVVTPLLEYTCMHNSLHAQSWGKESVNPIPVILDDIQDTAIVSNFYDPIRIKVFFPDLENTNRYCNDVGQIRPDFYGGVHTCGKQDILTDEKKDIFMHQLIPAARKMHQDRIKVKRLYKQIPVAKMSREDFCGAFSLPDSHIADGVSDADFVVYAAAGPGDERPGFGGPCGRLASGRPLVSVIQIGTRFFNQDALWERVVAHEMLHGLAFDASTYINRGIIGEVSEVRGKAGPLKVVVSTKVLEIARFHFNCPTLSNMELEDEDATGSSGSGTIGSHWKRRNMAHDLMTASGPLTYYTAMTLALLEDLGFYQVNYELAEAMPWGREAGCKFFTDKCVTDGETNYSWMFCTEALNYPTCDADHRLLGFCSIRKYAAPMPSAFQYFVDDTVVGTSGPFMDFCPIVEMRYDSHCLDGEEDDMPGSVVGANSRCFDITPMRFDDDDRFSRIGGICAEVLCEDCHYSIRVKGASFYTRCTPGVKHDLSALSSQFKNGSLICPQFSEMCTDHMAAPLPSIPYLNYCDLHNDHVPKPSVTPPVVTPPAASGSMVSSFTAVLSAGFILYWVLAMEI